MLFESPFYVDYPLGLGLGFGIFAVVALWMLLAFNRRGSFHDAVVEYFHRRSPGVPMEKWSTSGRFMFLFFVLVWSVLGLYCLSIGIGVVKNKDNSIPSEQIELLKRIYEKQRPEQKNGIDD